MARTDSRAKHGRNEPAPRKPRARRPAKDKPSSNTRRLAASEARQTLSEVLNRVNYRGERVILHRHGKDLAALVPMQDIALLQAMEDRYDLELARKALREPGAIPWEKVKAQLGL